MTETRFRHTPDMGDISGFYEDTCQRMLEAGARWLAEHPEADPRVKSDELACSILVEENEDARTLSKITIEAALGFAKPGGDLHCDVIERLLSIKAHGWESYCNGCRETTAELQFYATEED